MRNRTLIECIASAVDAYKNCVKMGNKEWENKHIETIKYLQDELPHGSGIDSGTKIDVDKCKSDRIVLTTSYHHMDENGFYSGWTDHIIRVYPSFDGIRMTISGPDRNQIKEYLHECYYWCLRETQKPDGMFCDDDYYNRLIKESLGRVEELYTQF